MSAYPIDPAERRVFKDPDALLDYAFDWTDWLGGSSIASFTVTAEAPLVLVSSRQAAGVVIARLSGGTAGLTLGVHCRVQTDDLESRIDDRTRHLWIKQR